MALSEIEFGVKASEQIGADLQAFSQQKRDTLKSIATPTRKTESWKYSAKRLKLAESYPSSAQKTNAEISDYASKYDLDCHTVIISNGRLQGDLPKVSGLTLKGFSELTETESAQLISGTTAQSDHLAFADLNAAFIQEGLYVNVEKNAQIDKPVRIVFAHNGSGNSFPRVYVHLETGSSLTLIEELSTNTLSTKTQSTENTPVTIVNSVCDLHVSDNAKLQYLRMNLDQGFSKQIGATGVALHRDARFESYCMALGNDLTRHDLHVKMLAPGAECDLNGVCITTDQQHFDAHTCIEHIASNCTSNETYRCIADKKSQIVFNGRIHIHRDAQKTLGSMSNKNLLLSSEAEIDSKPELEIYADDVKCAHGTTIGQLDETELYYLQTRGLSFEQAKLMLTLGFVLEVVRATPIEAIAQFWEQQLSTILSFEA